MSVMPSDGAGRVDVVLSRHDGRRDGPAEVAREMRGCAPLVIADAHEKRDRLIIVGRRRQ